MSARSLIDWWLRPWQEAPGGALRRTGRIYLLVGLLAVTVTPGMILAYGPDGWLWSLTASVLLCAPPLVAAADALAARSRLRRQPLGRLAVLYLGVALGVLAGYAATLLLPHPPLSDVGLLARDYRRTLGILSTVIAAMSVGAAVVWYRGEALRLRAAAAAAAFATLKGQLQPHFLFNALNSLKELIVEDSPAAVEVTQHLADLYRLILAASASATTALADELTIVESYCAIERVRYGERLRYAIDVAPELRRLHVPSLMLQTLVENAIRHGVCKSRSGGELSVRASRREDGWLDLVIANSGAPFAPAAGRGTGLANTRTRLALMYGAGAGFSIGSDEAGNTVARFAVSGAPVGGQ